MRAYDDGPSPFVADGGVGTYSFESRLRSLTNGGTSGYSPPAKITVTGYFWHVIAGENDRIYYTIVVQKGRPYEATVDRIDLGGLFEDKDKTNPFKAWLEAKIEWIIKSNGSKSDILDKAVFANV